MKHKTITIKIIATLPHGAEFKEYQTPQLDKLLEDGWKIQEIHQAVVNQSAGFVFITYVLRKD